MDEDEVRSVMVRFRVRPDELDKIQEKADKAGLTVSRWIRQRLLGVRS